MQIKFEPRIKPKTEVLWFRSDAENKAKIDTLAEKHNITRVDAIRTLIDIALGVVEKEK